jgi:hypothetical protein
MPRRAPCFRSPLPVTFPPVSNSRLTMPCETIVADETDILPRLERIDVLVTMALTAEMRRAVTGLKLVQVPAAGLDRIDLLPWRTAQCSPMPMVMRPASPNTSSGRFWR